MSNVADDLLEVLVQAGVTRIYGLVGDSLNAISDAVRRSGGAAKGGVDGCTCTTKRAPPSRRRLTLSSLAAWRCAPGVAARETPPDPGGDGRSPLRRPGVGAGYSDFQPSDRYRLFPGDQTRSPLRAGQPLCRDRLSSRPGRARGPRRHPERRRQAGRGRAGPPR